MLMIVPRSLLIVKSVNTITPLLSRQSLKGGCNRHKDERASNEGGASGVARHLSDRVTLMLLKAKMKQGSSCEAWVYFSDKAN